MFVVQKPQRSSEAAEPLSERSFAHQGVRCTSKNNQWGAGRVRRGGGLTAQLDIVKQAGPWVGEVRHHIPIPNGMGLGE